MLVAWKLPIATQKDVLVDEFKAVQLSGLPSEQGRIEDKWNNISREENIRICQKS